MHIHRATTIEELRGRLELAEQRLDEAEEGKKRSNDLMHAIEAEYVLCVCVCVCVLCVRAC